MRFLKKYKAFFEDGEACANASNASGMGDVVSSQPGALPGTPGTTGSGDVSFTFKKGKRKKGGPSQVSDLRDLKDVRADVVNIKESYYDKKEFVNGILDELKQKNIRPLVLNQLIEFYDDEITKDFEDGRQPKFFTDKIVKELELDSGGFLSQQIGSGGYNQTIKYL